VQCGPANRHPARQAKMASSPESCLRLLWGVQPAARPSRCGSVPDPPPPTAGADSLAGRALRLFTLGDHGSCRLQSGRRRLPNGTGLHAL